MVKVGARLSVGGLLFFGTLTSLFSKIVYELQGEGLDGEMRYFRKPWFMTMLMFMGMSLCLPLAWLEERSAAAATGTPAADATTSATEPLLTDGAPQNGHEKRSELRDAVMLSIPTVFDLIATILMNVGLLSVTASVYQMMRGAEMVFAAILAVAFLQRALNKLHFMGIGCCICGICLVGVSSILAGEGGTAVPVTGAQVALGMALIVLSQCVQAAQVTFEDYFMSEMSVPAMKIVGYEGVIGTFLMLFIMAPIVRMLPGEEGHGIHEDLVDTIHMVKSDGRLAIVLVVQMFGLLAYNYSGMHVTGNLGAVFRTVLETMRTLFVWLLGLALFYLGTGLGESWNKFSPLQALGFAVLVVGTVVYGQGDERAAAMAVQRYREASAAGDVEAAAASLAGKPVPAASAAPTDVPAGASPSRPVHIMPSSSFRASHSINTGSYAEAVASSMRSQGYVGSLGSYL